MSVGLRRFWSAGSRNWVSNRWADSGYIQRVPLIRMTLGGSTHFAVHAGAGVTQAVRGLRPLIDVGPGMPPPRTSADGQLVFVGYGVPRPGGGDDLARVPVEGRVVVVVNGAPSGADAGSRAELESPTAVVARLDRILPLHPAAVIVLLTGSSVDLYTSIGRVLARGTLMAAGDSAASSAGAAPQPAVASPSVSATPSSSGVTPAVQADFRRDTPMILVGIPERGSPLLPARWPRDDRPQVLHGAVHRFSRGDPDISQGYNVVAAVPGRDPAFRGSWVAFSAHLDHLGILPVAVGDSVAHGADDDGSGRVALLAWREPCSRRRLHVDRCCSCGIPARQRAFSGRRISRPSGQCRSIRWWHSSMSTWWAATRRTRCSSSALPLHHMDRVRPWAASSTR